jgi:hypothetical protein
VRRRRRAWPRGSCRGVALQISPPFVIMEDEIATLARVLGEALDEAA